MKIKTILCLSLAACCLTVSATPRKKKTQKKPEVVRIQPVPADTFSYAIGTLQSESLVQYLMQREGVDSAHLSTVAQALRDASAMTEAQIKEKEAYAAGLRIAKMNADQVVPSLNQSATGKRDTVYTDLKKYTEGLADGLLGKTKITPVEARRIAERQFNHFKQELQMTNEAWLVANAKKEGVKTTASGLQYRVIQQGKGAVATDTTEVEVNYEGKLIDGTEFDSSYKRGKSATFRANQVIKGWTEALKMMPEGSIYELYIPYNLGYGERGNQNIPPYSTLIFKVEVLKVLPAKDGAAKK